MQEERNEHPEMVQLYFAEISTPLISMEMQPANPTAFTQILAGSLLYFAKRINFTSVDEQGSVGFVLPLLSCRSGQRSS